MQPSPTQAEMLDNVENLHRPVLVAVGGLLLDYQVDVHIRVNEVAICTASHRSLDSHQAMLLCALKRGLRLQVLVTRVLLVRLDPANVLTAPKAPFSKTLQAEMKLCSSLLSLEQQQCKDYSDKK